MNKNKKIFSKSASLLLLLLGLALNPCIALSQSNEVPYAKEVIYRDTHREMPGHIDFGAYQTYKISPEEIAKMNPQKLREITEIYVRRYYDYYMYFSRNIIIKQCNENYPCDLIDPIIKSVTSLSDNDLKKLVTDFYNSEDGVSRENQRIHSLLVPIMHEFEMKKFGALKSLTAPAFHSPNAIYLAFLKKIELRANDYKPPFYPKGMDPNDKEVFNNSYKKSDSLINNKIISHGLVFIFGLIFGALILKIKTLKYE